MFLRDPHDEFPTREFVKVVLFAVGLAVVSTLLRTSGFQGIAPFTIVGFLGGLVVWRWVQRKREVNDLDREWREFSRHLDNTDNDA